MWALFVALQSHRKKCPEGGCSETRWRTWHCFLEDVPSRRRSRECCRQKLRVGSGVAGKSHRLFSNLLAPCAAQLNGLQGEQRPRRGNPGKHLVPISFDVVSRLGCWKLETYGDPVTISVIVVISRSIGIRVDGSGGTGVILSVTTARWRSLSCTASSTGNYKVPAWPHAVTVPSIETPRSW